MCTWSNGHVPVGLAAIENDCHVFCEKPMAMGAKEAEKLKAAAEKKGKVLGLGFVRGSAKMPSLAREVSHFVDCCLDAKPFRATGVDGLEMMKILDSIYTSAQENK